MINLRKYGTAPFKCVVVHGGPGAVGEMQSVALYFSKFCGVLEPLQTATTVHGQIEELNKILIKDGDFPLTLIGFSWGAWLSILAAVTYPTIVERLILIGCPPFNEKYLGFINARRKDKLSIAESKEFDELLVSLKDPSSISMGNMFSRLVQLLYKTDSHDPITNEQINLELFDRTAFGNIWAEAAEMRRSGELLKCLELINCKVCIIHGEFDPHPVEGVIEPLSTNITNLEIHVLNKCGHKPWIEKYAHNKFYEILEQIVKPFL